MSFLLKLSNSSEFAIIDKELAGKICSFSWKLNNKGYVVTGKKMMSLHRLICGSYFSDLSVDHVNGNKLDNRQINLRACTHAENSLNRKVRSNSKTGFKGVRSKTGRNKFEATIRVNSKDLYLGSFDTAIEAARAYDNAAIKHFGEFARLNFTNEAAA